LEIGLQEGKLPIVGVKPKLQQAKMTFYNNGNIVVALQGDR
jgi:hypothetical protein